MQNLPNDSSKEEEQRREENFKIDDDDDDGFDSAEEESLQKESRTSEPRCSDSVDGQKASNHLQIRSQRTTKEKTSPVSTTFRSRNLHQNLQRQNREGDRNQS